MKIAVFIIWALAMLIIYAYAENKTLITRRYRIKTTLPKGMSPLKIVQISDVHRRIYPNRWARMLVKVKSLEPDLILITGDLVSRNVKDLSPYKPLVEELCKIAPVYCCKGNHELDLPPEIMSEYCCMLSEYGAQLLDNSTVEFEKNGERINITGASLEFSCYKNRDGGYLGLYTPDVKRLRDDLGEKSGFTVLLAHNPFFARVYAEWGADVTFSGHVHGGAVRLPFVGGVLSPERKFFPKNSKGVYDNDGKKLVVSAGIGKLRLFNPPEIVYTELEGVDKCSDLC